MAQRDVRTVVVTGATRGLGRALVGELASLGQVVVGCGRSPEKLAELDRSFPAPHRFDAVDVADDAAVSRWAEQVLASHGPPDLVLNNAALINANRPLWEIPAAEFDEVLDVNVKGTVNVLRAFLPAMIDRGKGIVVNFSSGWGRSTSAEVAPYCATKWAIEGLTQALAQELPSGLAAIPLNPGIIDTDMLRSAFGAGAGRYPRPDAWARRAVPFLLSLGPRNNGDPLTVPDP